MFHVPAHRSGTAAQVATIGPALPRAYEVRNPSFGDMSLDEQIEAGINDWCAEGASGHPYFGATKQAAEATRDMFRNR